MENQNSPRLIRQPEVQSLTGLPKSTLYRKISLGQFPKPAPIGDKAVAWVEREVIAWVESQIAVRDSAA